MATLTIDNAPDEVVERLRRRAERREHSVEAELLEIIEEAVVDEDVPALTLDEVVARIRALGLTSADESVAMIREDRDRADGRR